MSISVAKIKVSSVRRTLPKIGRCKVYFEIAQFIDMLRGASDRPLRRLMKPREEILSALEHQRLSPAEIYGVKD